MALASVFLILALYCWAGWEDMKEKEQRRRPEEEKE